MIGGLIKPKKFGASNAMSESETTSEWNSYGMAKPGGEKYADTKSLFTLNLTLGFLGT